MTNLLSPIELRRLAKAFPGTLKAFPDRASAIEAGKWLREVLKYGAEGTNTQGGFVTPIETLTSAILSFRDRVGLMRRYAGVFPIGTDHAIVPRRNGNSIAGLFVAENATSTAMDLSFDAVSFSPKKVMAATRVSSELEEDAGSGFFADWLAQELGFALALLEDQALILGDGTSTYGGITGLRARFVAGLGTYAGSVDAATGNDTFAEVTAADLASALAKVPTWSRDVAWYCSQPAFAHVFCRLAAGAGGIGTSANGEPTFWGLPIRISNVFPTVLTDLSDVPMLYVGDLSAAAYVGSRREFKLKRSTGRYLEFDQVFYAASSRFDIVVDPGDATAASGLVALMGE